MSQSPISFKEFFNLVWSKVPEVWRTEDSQNGNGLLILVYTFAQHMYYYFYNNISSMDDIFDIDLCPVRYLPFLANLLNWKLQGTDVDSWRQQLRTAPLLYKLKGTKRGLLLAEKLVGYSIHLSNLYKDTAGNLVPKEKIYNSLPLSYKKPWKRKTSTINEYHDVFNQVESDEFYPFVEGLSQYNSQTGEIYPRQSYKRVGSS